MNNEEEKVRPRQIVALVTAIILTFVVSAVLAIRAPRKKPTVIPGVISDFLSEYLASDYVLTEDNNVFYKYFTALADEANRAELGESYEEYTFERVFKSYDFGVNSYSIELVSKNFVIIRLYSSDGELLPPPVGFWFKLSRNRKSIDDWRIGRLQPFSTYDAEYSEVWDATYS